MNFFTPTYTELLTLNEQLRLECDAMARFAFGGGLKISDSTMQLLEQLPCVRPNSTSIEQFTEDCPENPQNQERPLNPEMSFTQLGQLHAELALLILPALPSSVLFMQTEENRKSWLHFLGPVPLARKLMLVSTLSLVAFLLLSTFPEVTGEFSWNTDSGWKLFVNELFVITASALGASFSSLLKVHQYIRNGTFNPKFDYFAWVRLYLGVVAGTILAILIPVDDTTASLSKPLLSMLGGFSVELVEKLLERMITTVNTLVGGDNSSQINSDLRSAAQAKSDDQIEKNRLQFAAKIMVLKDSINSSQDIDQLNSSMENLLEELLPNVKLTQHDRTRL